MRCTGFSLVLCYMTAGFAFAGVLFPCVISFLSVESVDLGLCFVLRHRQAGIHGCLHT